MSSPAGHIDFIVTNLSEGGSKDRRSDTDESVVKGHSFSNTTNRSSRRIGRKVRL